MRIISAETAEIKIFTKFYAILIKENSIETVIGLPIIFESVFFRRN